MTRYGYKTSIIVPFVERESPEARHKRRIIRNGDHAVAVARVVDWMFPFDRYGTAQPFRVNNRGEHWMFRWQVRHPQDAGADWSKIIVGRTRKCGVDWYPSTAQLIVNGVAEHDVKVYDFLQALAVVAHVRDQFDRDHGWSVNFDSGLPPEGTIQQFNQLVNTLRQGVLPCS